METVVFYICMVLIGVFYAIVYCNPTGELANSSFAAKYPLLGVFAFFSLMAGTYWLLTMAEKDICNTFFGFLALAIALETTRQIYKNLKRNK